MDRHLPQLALERASVLPGKWLQLAGRRPGGFILTEVVNQRIVQERDVEARVDGVEQEQDKDLSMKPSSPIFASTDY